MTKGNLAISRLALLLALGAFASCGLDRQQIREPARPMCALNGAPCRQPSDCCNECFGGRCISHYP